MDSLKNIAAVLKVVRAISEASPKKEAIIEARRDLNYESERRNIHEATSNWAKRLVNDFDMHIKVVNAEYMPHDGACLYVSNHQSYLDIVALYAILDTQAGFIAKDAFKKIPFFNSWILRVRSLYINRGNARSALDTINTGVSYLENGFSLIIFPEATRSRGGAMHEFKPGSFKLATKSGVPIVPITINGTYKVYEGNGVITPNQDIEIIFHKPISTKDLSREEQVKLPKMVEDIIKKDVIIDPKYAELKKLYI